MFQMNIYYSAINQFNFQFNFELLKQLSDKIYIKLLKHV